MVTSLDIAWSAGFIEGEGCFDLARKSPRVSAVQVQLEPLTRLQNIFGGTIGKFDRLARGKPCTYHRWYVYGPRAAGVAMTLYALLSPRRKTQAKKIIDTWKAATTRIGNRQTWTHCLNGHEYTKDNTRWYRGRRNCRECKRGTNARYLAKQG